MLNLDLVTFSENDSHSIENQNEKQNLTIVPKTFWGNEMFDGKTVVFCLKL